jgi:uncharacterized delta-60 repeat protein
MKYILHFLLLVFTMPVLSYAQILDSTFGINGISRVGFSPSYHSELQQSVLHPDGKISSVGFSGAVGFTSHILVSRHLSTGVLDSSFNGDGSLVFSYGGNNEQARALALLQSGNLLVGGVSSGKPALAMLKPDGSFDASFNNSGIKLIDLGIGNGGRINKIIQQSDGKLLAIGYGYNGSDFDMLVCRLFPNGSLDSSWGQNGIGLYPTGTYNNFCNDAALQSTGKIILAGYSSTATDYVTVVRLNTNGSVDSSFGVNGRYHQSIGSSLNELTSIFILPNDDVLLAGSISGSPLFTIDHLTIKLKENGSTDNTFGNMGVSIHDIRNTEDQSYCLYVYPDGSFLQSGFSYNTSGLTDFVCFKNKANGSLDSSFGTNGIYIVPFGGTSWIKSILMQPDGKIILCGQSSTTLASMGEFTLLRLKSNNPTSTSQQEAAQHKIAVFPNPTNGILHVQFTNTHSKRVNYVLLDLFGKAILEDELADGGDKIDISKLTKGTYILRIVNPEVKTSILVLRE